MNQANNIHKTPYPILDSNRNQAEIHVGLARILMICLVVDLHLPEANQPLAFNFIRMPLYFVLSGILYRPRPILEFAKLKGISLLVPYFAYLFLLNIHTVLGFVKNILTGLNIETYTFYRQIATKLTWGGSELLDTNLLPLWFLTSLYFTQQSYNLIHHITKNQFIRTVLVLVPYFVGVYLFFQSENPLLTNPHKRLFLNLPLGIHTLSIALPLFYIGSVIGRRVISSKLLLMICIACSILTLGVHFFITDLQIVFVKGGIGIPGVSLICAASISLLTIAFSDRLTRKLKWEKKLKKTASTVITIFALHMPVIFYLSEVDLPRLVKLLICILVPVIIHCIFSRFRISRAIFLGDREAFQQCVSYLKKRQYLF